MIKNSKAILFFVSLAIMGLSFYMTVHYFAVKYPIGLESSALCNINQYFNCDKTTESGLSNLAGVPISAFGFLIGAFLFLSLATDNQKYQNTLYSVLTLNFGLCLFLFLVSVLFLKGLCPFCTGYYILSGIALYIFNKRGSQWGFNWKVLGGFALVMIVVSGSLFQVTHLIAQKPQQQKNSLQAFEKLPLVDTSHLQSPFHLADHPAAPLQIKLFSDFQCPACKAFSKMIPALKERYKDKIDIQYFFFPLDPKCNPEMDHRLHDFACKAARIAICSKDHFESIHDELFLNQDSFSDKWLDNYAKSKGLSECVQAKQTSQELSEIIQLAKPVNVPVTPTLVINGRKIRGGPSQQRLFDLLDKLLESKP